MLRDQVRGLYFYRRVFLLPFETAVTLKGLLENQNLELSSFFLRSDELRSTSVSLVKRPSNCLPIIKVLLPPPFPTSVTLGVKVRASHFNVGAIEIWPATLPGEEFLRTSAICLHF